jgi:NAD(P)-dependent dehydrogenase (short-subunit alcohol dehydrogenase family)
MTAQTGKVALVTGGAQGIGKGIARGLLERSYAVVVGDADAEAGEESAAELAEIGEVLYVMMDVSELESVENAFKAILSRHGRLDALVNNAGIAQPYHPPIQELKLDYWNRVIGTNLTGIFLTSRFAAGPLKKTEGAIVNIASTRAVQSEPHTEAYSASKGGLVALTHALAISLGPEVRVNCISPGWIDTAAWKKASERHESHLSNRAHAQHPVGRAGNPQDVAALTAWLLSDEAGFVTGQNYVLDGGMTRRMIYED